MPGIVSSVTQEYRTWGVLAAGCWRPSVSKCWGHSGLVECKGSIGPSECCELVERKGNVGPSKHCELVEHEGSIGLSEHWGPACWQQCGGWMSCCHVLTGWRLGVDRWLHCGQSEPGVVLQAVCPVQGCRPIWNAGDVNSLMAGDHLVPKKRWAHFYALAASSSLLRGRVKNDADWRRHM